MRADFTYVVGRVLGVVSRPAALFIANHFLAAKGAQQLALGFLVSTLGLVAVAADPHRRFYPREFAHERGAHPIVRQTYLWSVALLMMTGALLCLGIIARFDGSWALAAVTAGYFISEKLVDEVLRYRLFARNFAAWGIASCTRAMLQLALFGVLLLTIGTTVSSWLVLLAFATGNLVVFATPLLRHLSLRAGFIRLKLSAAIVLRAARSLFSNRRIWMMALLTAAVAYLDRLVGLVIDRDKLPVFMLIVMCFSVVQMAVDFFYVSRKRREFLEQSVTLRAVFSSGGVLASLGTGTLVAIAAAAFVLFTARNSDEFPLLYLVAIAVVQISTALALVLREILYWGHDVRHVMLIETVFWGSFAAIAAAAWLGDVPVSLLLILAIVGLLVRLGLYFFFALRMKR